MNEPTRITDERLASLARAYRKMGFESSFADIASAFEELQEYRRRPSAEALAKAYYDAYCEACSKRYSYMTFSTWDGLSADVREIMVSALDAAHRSKT